MVEGHNVDGVGVLKTMAERNCFFGLDIGTEADDLLLRQACVEKAICQIEDSSVANKVRKFVYFSAGIWPSVEEIHDRKNRVDILKSQIEKAAAAAQADQETLNRRIVAIGEIGLDHHWNPSGVDGRCESDFDRETMTGERELFEMQLNIAREMNLPVLIHSRDAFKETLEVLDAVGYHNGVIHCFSYGLEEAKAFLERGWYLAFGGGVTYNKKAKLEAILELLRYVPAERFLCETDAPYLAPVPLRGTVNTPVNVELVYQFAAQARGISPEELSALVDQNIRQLGLA